VNGRLRSQKQFVASLMAGSGTLDPSFHSQQRSHLTISQWPVADGRVDILVPCDQYLSLGLEAPRERRETELTQSLAPGLTWYEGRTLPFWPSSGVLDFEDPICDGCQRDQG